ncbi:MAG TPA: beta-ketoacyl-ACP reductase, partial [Psychrobacter sp.]|nr:beta-ketoacyl-ACP reductase [Psychrobacter sp.]
AYASEIAAACMYLISDEAQFVTGETISVNGGEYMS